MSRRREERSGVLGTVTVVVMMIIIMSTSDSVHGHGTAHHLKRPCITVQPYWRN